MNMLSHAIIAPLVRGLYLNKVGLSRIVVPAADFAAIPAAALDLSVRADMRAAIAKVEGADGSSSTILDEMVAAKVLIEALEAWVFDRAPAGVDAPPKTAAMAVTLPSLIVAELDDEKTAYWIAPSVDEAHKRAETFDASVVTVVPPDLSEGKAAAAARSDVVKGRIALVTGGAQGFGEEIVRGLVSSGATTFIADLNIEGAKKLAATLNAEAGRTIAIPVASNVSDEASVEAMFNTVASTVGGLDLCVSNAGVLKAGSVLDQEIGAFKFVTDVNYVGFFIVSKHCGRRLRRQPRTAPAWRTDIVQINSKSGLEGSNKNGAYAGGKFGGIGLVASFALELIEHGIKVNAICPGNFFNGPLWSDPEKGLFVQYLKAGKVPGARSVADVKAFYEAKVPMKRGCEGADVMRALYYIVEQEYETGQAVPVTGGQIMLH